MASRSKYERNKLRKEQIKEHGPNLLALKTRIAKVCKVDTYKKVIENINAKLQNKAISEDLKQKLLKELQIYENKVNTTEVLSNKEKWNLQFEKDQAGQALRRMSYWTRCNLPTCARPRGIVNQFGLCRLHVREMIGKWLLPGNISQRSW